MESKPGDDFKRVFDSIPHLRATKVNGQTYDEFKGELDSGFGEKFKSSRYSSLRAYASNIRFQKKYLPVEAVRWLKAKEAEIEGKEIDQFVTAVFLTFMAGALWAVGILWLAGGLS